MIEKAILFESSKRLFTFRQNGPQILNVVPQHFVLAAEWRRGSLYCLAREGSLWMS